MAGIVRKKMSFRIFGTYAMFISFLFTMVLNILATGIQTGGWLLQLAPIMVCSIVYLFIRDSKT